MSITASEARRTLFPLIEQVNDDRTAVEITSKRGNAVIPLIMSEGDAKMAPTKFTIGDLRRARALIQKDKNHG